MTAEDEDIIPVDDGVVTWRTDDITLAAYLKLSEELIGVEWEGSKCFWVFEDTDDLADRVSEYVGGQAEANLREYNSVIAAMKREMYDEQRARYGVPRGLRS